MHAITLLNKQDIRKETDSLGEVDVPSDKLWGAQTQRSLEHFNMGQDLYEPPLQWPTSRGRKFGEA